MKKLLFWLPAFILMVGVSSCLEEDDDLYNIPYRNWVSIYKNDSTPTLKADNGTLFEVTNKQGDSTFYEVGDRGSVLFTLASATHTGESTYPIVMKEFIKATVKPFVNDTDAVFRNARLAKFKSGIVSNNYLNVLVETYDSDDAVNTVELVRYSDEETHHSTDSLPEIRVRLQHNVVNVKKTKKVQAVCFDLSSLKVEYPGKAGYILRLTWTDSVDGLENGHDLRYSVYN